MIVQELDLALDGYLITKQCRVPLVHCILDQQNTDSGSREILTFMVISRSVLVLAFHIHVVSTSVS